MIRIAIMGCGKIAHRIAKGIQFFKTELWACASRNQQKAEEFAKLYQIPHAYTIDECLKDEQIDLIYIAAANPAHYELTKKCLLHQKHVLCEKPFLKNSEQIQELFHLAKENHCFLMEAHKTCFTPLNQLLIQRIDEIGPLTHIKASYCAAFDLNELSAWNTEKEMGGAFFDIGVYPIVFANYYSQSKIASIEVKTSFYKDYACDFEGSCKIVYQNGITADLAASWLHEKKNEGILIGEKGKIVIENFWKNTKAHLYIDDHEEVVEVKQDSDFTGEINHAAECIEKGLLESPIMSSFASLEIMKVLEKVKQFQ